jgi:tetratricopeptide (TPR) repeat protein
MNLSVIERMIRDGDMSTDAMRYLLSCHCECEWLDYKEIIHLELDAELCDFARDVLALKNVGGGYIVIGVKDKTWEPIGLSGKLQYDSKLIRDKIRRATGLDLDVDIVHHNIQTPASTGLFALIFIRSTHKRKKRRVPTLASKDFCGGKPFGIRRGEIYVRRGDSTVKVQSEHELEDLLDGLENQTDNDAIMLSGRSSYFAVEDATYRLLEKGYEQFVGRTKLRQELLNSVTRDPRIWIINVHGAGGVGKTALVNWVVYEFYKQRTFEAILQLTAKETVLTAKGIEKFGRSLYSLENLLDHILFLFQETPPEDLEKKKKLAIEYLSAWRTLLVLDNMETVQDGRILNFVQQLPPESKAKVLITSRQKTGSWELPFPIQELDSLEVSEFLKIRSEEMKLNFPYDDKTALKVLKATGGLPLAIQWVLGQYRIKKDVEAIVQNVLGKDSPVLEFSFRNIWHVLSGDAKAILAVLSIFDDPPTSQQITITTEFSIERIEKALAELSDVTLVTRNTQISDGRIIYIALPITLSFARHQLSDMGDFELNCRRRFQKFSEQMALQESELFRYRSRFEQFSIETDNEKRAAILCQRGESEMFVGNVDSAETLFKQARDLAPQSAYIYAMSASYELARNRVGNALSFAEEGCKRATKKTGALCYTIKARILEAQRNHNGRVAALEKAIDYDPNDLVIRHQYGVALSRAGHPQDAIKQFSIIIEKSSSMATPTVQLLMALKTRMINTKRLGLEDEYRKDLLWAKEIFVKYPHLSSQAEHFTDLFELEN